MLREPAVAGAFYPDNPENLKVAIEDSFLSPFGVGKIPEDIKKFDGKDYPINIMAPHAGYIYSAPIASHSYYKIAEYGIPDVFIILSPNHTGFGSEISVFNKGEWKTPFGLVEVDNEFAEEIISDSEIASADFSAHVSEHAIEVQLPFLQYLSNNFKIVPIVIHRFANLLAVYIFYRKTTVFLQFCSQYSKFRNIAQGKYFSTLKRK